MKRHFYSVSVRTPGAPDEPLSYWTTKVEAEDEVALLQAEHEEGVRFTIEKELLQGDGFV